MEVTRFTGILILILATLLQAAERPTKPDVKPACSSSTRGLYWPQEANRDPKALQRFAKDGTLERCVSGPWHHKWQLMTISAKAAVARDKDQPAVAEKPRQAQFVATR